MKFAVVASLLALVPLPAAAQTRNWPSENPPRPIASRDVKFPPYAVKTLANGLQVIAVSHHEQPAVSLRLIVRAGAETSTIDVKAASGSPLTRKYPSAMWTAACSWRGMITRIASWRRRSASTSARLPWPGIPMA